VVTETEAVIGGLAERDARLCEGEAPAELAHLGEGASKEGARVEEDERVVGGARHRPRLDRRDVGTQEVGRAGEVAEAAFVLPKEKGGDGLDRRLAADSVRDGQ